MSRIHSFMAAFIAAFIAAVIAAVIAAFSAAATVVAVAPAAHAKSNATVRLVTHDSFAVSKKVLAEFTKQTGIKVEILQNGDGGTIVNQAILTKDNPIGDVLYGVDNTFLTRALDEGIFEKYRSPALADVSPVLQTDTKSRVTPIDYADVCINYDKNWFADEDVKVPTSLGELTKPAYRGRLVVEDPSTSSTGLSFMLATIAEFGENGWQQYWRDLRSNGVTVVDGWEQAFNDAFSGGGAGGSHPLVVSYASSPPVTVLFADPPIDKPTIGTMPGACFRQVEYAGILAGTENRAEARKLVDFLLSEKFQTDMPLQMFVFPARDGTPLPELFEDFADAPENPYTMTPTEIGANRDSWIREWTGVVLR